MFPLDEGEKITAVVPVKEFDENHFVFMATAQGTVKKTPLAEFSRPRPSGIIAVGLDEGDYLVGAALTDGKYDVMLFSSDGKAVRFEEDDVRPMGRQADRRARHEARRGRSAWCACWRRTTSRRSVLTATENGFGKRTPIAEYPRHGRGGQGMIAIQTSERNGALVGAVLVDDNDEVMLISTGGVLIRTAVAQIREMGRSTQGVTLISLDEGEKLAGLERIEERDLRQRQRQRRQRRPRRATAMRRHDEPPPSAGRAAAHRPLRCPRIFNFSAGPAMLPAEVLARAGDEMLDWHGSGMSVMEMSHRGKEFISHRRGGREATCASCSRIPANYKVLFLQGGATLQFAQMPMNLLRGKGKADYVDHRRVVEEGDQGGEAVLRRRTSPPSSEDSNFTYAPKKWNVRPDAAYVHYCSNETIGGVEFHSDARHRRRAAGGRRVVALPVAPAGRVEVRPDLRRRAEEHRPGGPDLRHRARRPDRQGARRARRR